MVRAIDARDVARTINGVLQRHGVRGAITAADLTFGDKLLFDNSATEALSKVVSQHLWPHTESATVHHYTTATAAQALLTSGVFRLYNLEKRSSEAEILHFCEVHGFDGYLATNANGIPRYRSDIMPQLYYASFAARGIDDDAQRRLWREFGEDEGARLTIRIEARNRDFRPLRYSNAAGQPIPLLRELLTTIWDCYGYRYVLSGVSRLCAFYLPAKYAHEGEYRMLFKDWSDRGVLPKYDGAHKYIEVPIGRVNPTGFEIHVVEVETDEELPGVDPKLIVDRS